MLYYEQMGEHCEIEAFLHRFFSLVRLLVPCSLFISCYFLRCFTLLYRSMYLCICSYDLNSFSLSLTLSYVFIQSFLVFSYASVIRLLTFVQFSMWMRFAITIPFSVPLRKRPTKKNREILSQQRNILKIVHRKIVETFSIYARFQEFNILLECHNM